MKTMNDASEVDGAYGDISMPVQMLENYASRRPATNARPCCRPTMYSVIALRLIST